MSRATVELENFTEQEATGLKAKLMIYLQIIRYMADVPMHVTSAHRPGDPGAHGSGWAVDISDNKVGRKVDSVWRYKVLRAAFAVGFRRIGVYNYHLHIDLDYRRDQDVTWWAESD